MIAGIVCGSCVGLAWIIIFSMWLLKQHKKRVARRKDPERVALREAEALREKTGHTTFIIPPDPAVINGQRKPGESAPQDRRSPSGGERLADVMEGEDTEEATMANDLYAEHGGKPLKCVFSFSSSWERYVDSQQHHSTVDSRVVDRESLPTVPLTNLARHCYNYTPGYVYVQVI